MLVKFEVCNFNCVGAIIVFTLQKIRGSWHPSHTSFQKFLRGHMRTVPGNMLVESEMCIFNYIGAISN